ncbi:PREDICTED: beta-1,3-galactosyltransferase 5-like [Priapulus caudatus]|uniref:Hexosyltransferase n=1 Tax=Priapulus caudatus TaxID=37621 RepID=A0ABM1EF31_PRICU|nr:PREDICTED: beta-1,3-galactosyltransferase 5-like [Priapulus caudatus]
MSCGVRFVSRRMKSKHLSSCGLGFLATVCVLLVYTGVSSNARSNVVDEYRQTGIAAYIAECGTLQTFTVPPHEQQFSYFLPQLQCPDRPWILALVISSAGDMQCRSAVRATWAAPPQVDANVSEPLRVLHLIADARNATADNEIMFESYTQGDVVQGNFADSYRNLTLKSIMGLHVASSACPRRPSLVVKIDCDTLLNVEKLLEFANGERDEDAIYGFLLDKDRPIRRPSSKNYVTRSEYDGDVYPPFIAGFFYVMTGDVPARLYAEAASSKRQLLHLEDVFVTGLLAERVGVRRRHLAGVMRRKPATWDEMNSAVAMHSLTPREMTGIHKKKTKLRRQEKRHREHMRDPK